MIPNHVTISTNNKYGMHEWEAGSACPIQRVYMMKKTTNDGCNNKLQQSLLEANVGCMLMLLLGFGLPFITLGLFFVYQSPSIALRCGLTIGVLVILGVFLTGQHYLRHVPAGEQKWWTWLVLAGTCVATLGLLAAIRKSRSLGNQYREATYHLR